VSAERNLDLVELAAMERIKLAEWPTLDTVQCELNASQFVSYSHIDGQPVQLSQSSFSSRKSAVHAAAFWTRCSGI